MKSVVMIAYLFPPEGNAGTFRPLRFVRQLSKIGWRTAVVCGRPYRYERYDPSLLASIPKETAVVPVQGRDLWQAIQARRGRQLTEKLSSARAGVAEQVRAAHHRPLRSRIRQVVRTLEAHYYLPDMARPWIRPALRATLELCKRNQPSVIWATAGPVSAWVVAQRVSKHSGVPYVLDLRDPYGLDYYEAEVLQSTASKHRYRRVLSELFKGAQSVVMMFDTLAECYLRAYPGALKPSQIHIIPNGYDGVMGDFEAPVGEKCLVLYTGTLSTYRYDTLLRALHSFKRTDPHLASHLQVCFMGDDTEGLARDSAALELSDIIEITGPRSQAEVYKAQQKAHALLILGRKPERKGHELVAGAKLFDYFKARRPVLGVLPRDETRKILERVGVSMMANSDSAEEITPVLRRLIFAWENNTLPSLLPNRDACETFSAEQQTAALVRAFERAPAVKPFVAGTVEIPRSLQGELGT